MVKAFPDGAAVMLHELNSMELRPEMVTAEPM